MQDLKLRSSNLQPYTDIMNDMLKQKNGVFRFVVVVHAGNIFDYVMSQYVTQPQREESDNAEQK